MSLIAKIHIAKNQLGLDEDDYRLMLARVTGKSSTKLMSVREQGRVMDELARLGFAPRPKTLTGPYAAKLQALWLSAYNLGVVSNRSDQAMLAFIKRQTGIDHTRFLRDAADARKAIEGLKSWLARETPIEWSEDDPQVNVLTAQAHKLHKLGHNEALTCGALRMEDGKLFIDEWREPHRNDRVMLQQQAGKLIRAAQKKRGR